jgi:hypothetical protein
MTEGTQPILHFVGEGADSPCIVVQIGDKSYTVQVNLSDLNNIYSWVATQLQRAQKTQPNP